jgi:UDP-glucoronosyl and UDP-glucosyl transferase.
MTFWERHSSTILGEFVRMGRKYYYTPKQDDIASRYFNYTDEVPSTSELETSTALVLVNNHFSLNYPKPLMPNLVQVGGPHIKQPQELPDVRCGKTCRQFIVIYVGKLRGLQKLISLIISKISLSLLVLYLAIRFIVI